MNNNNLYTIKNEFEIPVITVPVATGKKSVPLRHDEQKYVPRRTNYYSLDENDLSAIEKLMFLANKCVQCDKSLKGDPQVRSLYVGLDQIGLSHNPSFPKNNLILKVCNACGVKENRIKQKMSVKRQIKKSYAKKRK